MVTMILLVRFQVWNEKTNVVYSVGAVPLYIRPHLGLLSVTALYPEIVAET